MAICRSGATGRGENLVHGAGLWLNDPFTPGAGAATKVGAVGISHFDTGGLRGEQLRTMTKLSNKLLGLLPRVDRGRDGGG